MRIALIKPYNRLTYSFMPPLGLGYISSMLKSKRQHEVYLYEANRDRLNNIRTLRNFLKLNKPDLVGIQVLTSDLGIVREYLRCIKGVDKNIVIVAGGPHPSALPKETMDYFGRDLDFAVVGEGERSFTNLVGYLEGSKSDISSIKGLMWRNEDKQVIQNEVELLEYLDELPWPDWELLNPIAYPHAPHGAVSRYYPFVPILLSRGCLMGCNFCSASTIFGKKIRHRNIDDVISEIKFLINRFNIREILIQDDNFAFNKKRVLNFCDKIGKLNISWTLPNGICLNSLDEELVRSMKYAGCYAVSVGIESGSQRILNDMNKGLRLETVREKIAILKKYKIIVTAQVIIGYPTETGEDVLKTISFVKGLPVEHAAFSNFIPLPGSELYYRMKEEKRLDGISIEDLSYYRVTESFSPHITKNVLAALLKKAMRSFYLRPSVLIKNIINVGSFANLWYLIKRFFNNYL
ncbi:B12-binding domain-containing radical SAM protein [Candidatus Omnitrophota bacterium]